MEIADLEPIAISRNSKEQSVLSMQQPQANMQTALQRFKERIYLLIVILNILILIIGIAILCTLLNTAQKLFKE
jgi:hypothetical protein